MMKVFKLIYDEPIQFVGALLACLIILLIASVGKVHAAWVAIFFFLLVSLVVFLSTRKALPKK